MLPAVVAAASKSSVFQDPLGERRHVSEPSGADTCEVLCLRGELTSAPSFEFALRERTSRLASFRHACYARIRSVERLNDATLALVSDATPGARLSDVLEAAERGRVSLDINAALTLTRQLVSAVALLHEHAADVAHGAIGPERLVLTPNARLVIVEHVLGAALEQLRYSHERYWRDLRIPLPRSVAPPRFDQRADVTQIGVVALSLVLGRRLHEHEYPKVGDVVAAAWAISARGGLEPLPPGFRSWLMRALQLDPSRSFASAVDARIEFERMIGEGDYLASPQALEAFLTQYHACLAGPTELAPAANVPGVPNAPRLVEVQKIAAPPEPHPTDSPVRATVIMSTAPEIVQEEQTVRTVTTPRRPPRLIAFAVVLIAIVAGAGFAGRRYFVSTAAGPGTGTLVIQTNPDGTHVNVDGRPRGVSPLTLALTPGPHLVELRGDGDARSIPITIAAGAQVSQYVELPRAAAFVGQLHVRTEPAGAKVIVDGVARGVSPLTVGGLEPGTHAVVFDSEAGSVRQEVTIEPGVTGSLVVALKSSQNLPVSGWIAVTAPVDVQLFEDGRLLGTSESERIMVSAGKHDIEVANQPIGYRAVRTVQVQPGKVTPIAIELPKQQIALNAVPWAEVWIDGEQIGDTPIGDRMVAAGRHEVIFRHPELGEQRHTIIVTVAAPARLSVDMRKK